MTLTPNTVDIILFAILLIIAFLAFLKGFVKDFLSTINVVLAVIASFFLGPIISKFIGGDYPQILVDFGVSFIIFVVLLIIFSILSSRISNPLSVKIPNSVNQSLGFGFGFLKGYFYIAFAFAVLLSFYSNPEKNASKNVEKVGPEWFRESKSYDVFYVGAKMIKPLIDDSMNQIVNNPIKNPIKDSGKETKTLDDIIKARKLYDEINDAQDDAVPIANPDPAPNTIPKKEEEDSGYTKQEREKMKRLIEIMGN